MEENISIEFNKEELVSAKNFSKICRICLLDIKGTPFVDAIFKDKRVIDILSEHLVIEVKSEDCLPQNICSHCSEEVLKMCILIEQCQKADIFLRSYLKFSKQDQRGIYNVVIKDQENEVDVVMKDIELHGSIEVDFHNSLENDDKAIVNDCSDTEISKCQNLKVDRNNSDTKVDKEKKVLEICKRQCPTCLKYFTSGRLNQHMKVHTDNVRSHQCPTCLKHFAEEDLEQHMRIHAKKKPSQCQVCFKIFNYGANLRRHMMLHTEKRSHICEICGKAFHRFSALVSHKKTHVSYEEIDPETGVPSFTCSHCGRIFKRSIHYNAHVKKHETNDAIKTHEESTEQNVNLYECTICNKSYKTPDSLYVHRKQHGDKPYLCNQCGKRFLAKAVLKEHLTVHSGEKPHNCKFCDKSFARIASLELHLLIHTGMKPHHCNICGKSFTQANHLKYHMLTHTGEKQYECNICNKQFAVKGNLTVHVRTHTGERPYVCSVCYKGFYDSSSMKKHIKRHKKSA